jgi:diguanylate cyclase (GGDEF)-like protein/PAS domain S-box-containing protein
VRTDSAGDGDVQHTGPWTDRTRPAGAEAHAPEPPHAAPARILLVEDDAAEAGLIDRRLRRAWPDLELQRVDTPEELEAALAGPPWDAVLCDHVLPRMTSREVLATLRRHDPDVACILVSGRIGEEAAVAALHAGADDYVGKDQLARLEGALVRALRASETRRARRQTEAALRASEERYAVAAAGANDGLWDWHVGPDDVYLSPRWSSMMGLPATAACMRGLEPWFARIHPDDLGRVRDVLARHLADPDVPLEVEYRGLHEADGWRWMLLRGLAVRDASGAPTRVAGSVTDIMRRKEIEAQLAHGALHDPLTDLPNRALFHDRLAHALDRERRRRSLAAVLLIDLDRFKIINDSLGHPAGDRVIVTTARRLEACLRPGDTVARLGGDEFAMLVEGLHDPREAEHVADRLQEALRAPIDVGGREVYTSASIGIAMAPGGGRPEEVLRDADTAMYRAKAQGKARSAVFDSAMHARAMALLQLESDLRRAVERNELRVHYQPVVRLCDGSLRGLEALLRWPHPRHGDVSPARFVPLAEETGLIGRIGAWALTTVAAQARRWVEEGLLPEGTDVGVNVSGRELADPGLPAHIERVLADAGLSPDRLAIEITETSLVENGELAAATLARLRDLRVRVSLDDFGTGYSSLSYLQRFPVDCIKIDRSFVQRMDESTRFVAGLTALAAHLGMDTVAEGVETARQASQLAGLHCTAAQGWLYGEALPPERATERMRRGWRGDGAR